jgi:cytochrome c biogenesis protein CcmG/thiol:disulfide interchange protein DsbE|tara:strand:+ start:380 stop:901 length:522 start_codon:yes stop_codon:yes gene_type:complete
MKKIILALTLFFVLFIFAIFSQGLKTKKIYDTKDLIGKPILEIDLNLLGNKKIFNTKELRKNNFTIINFWASWCAPCRKEHKYLVKLSKNKNVKILGINFKDEKSKANAFLKELGDPFYLKAFDNKGKTSVSFGVYGIPETILVDKDLVIKKKYIGPINNKDVKEILKIINQK